MGVPRLWPWTRKKGFVPEVHQRVKLPTPSSKIRVDVCGSRHVTIRSIYNKHRANANANANIDIAHHKLEQQLLKLGNKDDLILYVDGQPAKEKADTHAHRESLRYRALEDANKHLQLLETRLHDDKRIRKHHITNVNKYLNRSFHWFYDHRRSFCQYMTERGYNITLCDTEADVQLAADCTEMDIVVTGDSDFLVYRTIPEVWQPVGQGDPSQFLVYNKDAVLDAVGLSDTKFTALAVVSSNDYNKNIPSLGIETNYKLIKNLDTDGDVSSIVSDYLKQPQVVRKNTAEWTVKSFTSSIKVFVDMAQEAVATSTTPSGDTDTALSYSSLQSRLDLFLECFKQRNQEAYEERVRKRAASATPAAPSPTQKDTPMFKTIDQPNPSCPHNYRSRYAHKERYGPHPGYHDSPEIMLQYVSKSWKQPPEQPAAPIVRTKNPGPIKQQLTDPSKRDLLDAMVYEHPTVTLDLGTLRANVRAVLPDDRISQAIIDTIRGAVREASTAKRDGQSLIGLYLEKVFFSPRRGDDPPSASPHVTIDTEDIVFLDHLCPRLSLKEVASGADEDESSGENDEPLGDSSKTSSFLHTFLTFMYSGNLPSKSGVGLAVNQFIQRLQHLQLLDKPDNETVKNQMPYTPSYLVRSAASQLSAELKRHYQHGCKELSDKIKKLEDKDKLPTDLAVPLRDDIPAIMMFMQLNYISGNKWSLVPLSPVEHGFLTFSEYELAAFLHKKVELHPALKELIERPPDDHRSFTQADVVRDWLPINKPGLLIRRLIAPVTPDGLTKKQLRKGKLASACHLPSLEEIRRHVNSLREHNFDPSEYKEKGYVPRGSIKTDGHRLQLLAFKMRELQSVRYRRYPSNKLPDPLLSTIGGTNSYLTEVRNVFSTKEDVERLLGCPAKQVDTISYLSIDLGQACVVGAYSHLPPDKKPRPKSKKRRGRKKRGSRGRKKRGGGCRRGKKTDRAGRDRFINLAVKQKAASQPTLKHRKWLERQKSIPLVKQVAQEDQAITSNSEPAAQEEQPPASNSEPMAKPKMLSISDIETALPPLHGKGASFADYLRHRNTHGMALDAFYNGRKFKFKKHKWYAKRSRAEEYHRITDSLLRMVGGSIGVRKNDEDKVVIGIGLGQFASSSRLSSLHGTFEAFFINKAQSLGYLVVGVNEYYTSKKCPTCFEFVAQTNSIRRLYCSHCHKYMHRDVMAAHNMCNILRGHVENQERPDYLQPMDENGSFIWQKGYKHEAKPQSTVTGGSSKRAAPGASRKRAASGSKRKAEEGDDPSKNEKKGGRRSRKKPVVEQETTAMEIA